MAQLRQWILFLSLILMMSTASGDDVRLILQSSRNAAESTANKVSRCRYLFQSCAVDPLTKERKRHWEIQSQLCRQNYAKNNCQKLVNDEPKLASKMQDCSPYGRCAEEAQSAEKMMKGCFWNAPKQFGVDIWDSIIQGSKALAAKAPQCIAPPKLTDKLISTWKCIAPIYWVYSAYNNMPSYEKIYNSGKDWVKKQGIKLDCYDTEAQTQMICYGVISVFAPDKLLKVAKYVPEVISLAKLEVAANSAAKARVAALSDRASVAAARTEKLQNRVSVRETKILKAKPPPGSAGKGLTVPRSGPKVAGSKTLPASSATLAADSTVPTALAAREAFSEKHVSKTFATEAQNEKWVQLANDPNLPPGTRFFDVENSAMKNLNDKTLDKNFVTALTNQHKELVISKVEALASKYPDVEFVRYSDFKSVRYALKPKPPATELPYGIESEMGKTFSEANKEFVQIMKEKNLVPEGQDPNWWFRSGWGDTADEATFAARYSRNAPSTNHMRQFTDADLRESQKTTLDFAEAYRMKVQVSLKNSSLLETSSVEGKMIPKAEVFDAIRKTETPEELSQFLTKTTGEQVTIDQARILQKYGDLTDEFSPGIHIAKREQAILDHKNGGITFDLVGAGSENSQATANALVRSQDVESAVKETRFGERSVTQNLNRRKAEIKNTVSPILDKYKIKARFVASGDDMALIPDKPLSPAIKKEIAEALAKTEKPSSIRMSSVGEGIPNVTDRMVMATQGESIEKATRKYLQGELPKDILDKTLVSVQMEGTAVGQGNVRLVLGEGVQLTAEQRKAFSDAFRKAVTQVKKANYKPIN